MDNLTAYLMSNENGTLDVRSWKSFETKKANGCLDPQN